MDAAAQLDGFLDKFSPDVAAEARTALAHMTARLPGATRLVYDNYNALAIGFGATDKAGGIILSIAVYPRWVSLFLMRGAELPDPHGLLQGSGGTIRHIRLAGPATLADPRVDALITAGVMGAAPPIDPDGPAPLIIKSVSAKQRPRR